MSITSIRTTRATYIENSRYLLAHFRHFITNQSNIQTVKACALACHTDDYCRTANYFSIDSICSLYEESAHVGTIVSSLSTTVIKFQLCPDGISEVKHICFADPTRAPIPLQTAFDSMSLVHTLPQVPTAIIMNTKLLYLPIAATTSVQVYDLETMRLINKFSQAYNIGYFDTTIDPNGNVQNTAVQCKGMISFLLNGRQLPSSSAWFAGPCFSGKYLIGEMPLNNKLRLWSYNATFLYDIDINFNSHNARSCLVFGDRIYVASNSSFQYVNITGSSLRTIYSMSRSPDSITVDAVGPHFFVSCSSCNFTGVTVRSENGTVLARVNFTAAHAIAKPSKYVYRLILADDSHLNVYEV